MFQVGEIIKVDQHPDFWRIVGISKERYTQTVCLSIKAYFNWDDIPMPQIVRVQSNDPYQQDSLVKIRKDNTLLMKELAYYLTSSDDHERKVAQKICKDVQLRRYSFKRVSFYAKINFWRMKFMILKWRVLGKIETLKKILLSFA